MDIDYDERGEQSPMDWSYTSENKDEIMASSPFNINRNMTFNSKVDSPIFASQDISMRDSSDDTPIQNIAENNILNSTSKYFNESLNYNNNNNNNNKNVINNSSNLQKINNKSSIKRHKKSTRSKWHNDSPILYALAATRDYFTGKKGFVPPHFEILTHSRRNKIEDDTISLSDESVYTNSNDDNDDDDDDNNNNNNNNNNDNESIIYSDNDDSINFSDNDNNFNLNNIYSPTKQLVHRKKKSKKLLLNKRSSFKNTNKNKINNNKNNNNNNNQVYDNKFYTNSWFSANPDMPYILSSYLQFVVNFVLLSMFLYIVTQFALTIRNDINHKFDEYREKVIIEISDCRNKYLQNRCDDLALPALKLDCLRWEKCANRDPSEAGRAKVSVETFAEILNAFTDAISYKTMFFLFMLVFGSLFISNMAFGNFKKASASSIYNALHSRVPPLSSSRAPSYSYQSHEVPSSGILLHSNRNQIALDQPPNEYIRD